LLRFRPEAKVSASSELSAFLIGERASVVRRFHAELCARSLELERGAAERLVDELARAVETRGGDAGRVFAEVTAAIGQASARRGAPVREAGHVLAALARAILDEWARARGRTLPVELAALIAEPAIEGAAEAASAAACAEQASAGRAHDRALSLALEQLDEGVRVLDAAGEATLVNPAADRLLGVRAPSELGREALRSRRRAGPSRRRVADAAGEERLIETLALPIVEDHEGARALGAVELTRDLSAELRRREELEHAERELHALHARVRRLGRDRAMGDLAAGAALALNNELNAIALRLRLVRAELPASLPGGGAALRHLDAIDAAAQKSARLVARLQELAARKPHGPPIAIDLNAAVLEALDLVRPELTAAAADRTVRVDARLGHSGSVLAPETELRELLCALLVAARDALPPGGALQLSTRCDRERAEVRLVYGAPRPDENAQLALEGARDSARRLGGALEDDVSGGVATLRLLLPRAATVQPRVEPGAAPAEERAARHVLVVDDDPGNRETLTELLAMSGYRAEGAADSAAALSAIEREDFDAALVDLAMPDMNGWELARRLRAAHPELRIAIVTGWEPAAGAPAPTDLAEAIFRKPVDLRAVQAFLDERPPAHAPERI
jgi:CheY-like chemotaxis protein/PAS domain-containing protein